LQSFGVAVIGAGAADMMCAADACKRGCTVLAVEHAMASAGGGYNFQWAWSPGWRVGRAA
jgi:predicted flavoprotein YhiN